MREELEIQFRGTVPHISEHGLNLDSMWHLGSRNIRLRSLYWGHLTSNQWSQPNVCQTWWRPPLKEVEIFLSEMYYEKWPLKRNEIMTTFSYEVSELNRINNFFVFNFDGEQKLKKRQKFILKLQLSHKKWLWIEVNFTTS